MTVVMPVYNGSEYLCAAIDSVLAQTHANLELIVVDDCSTDDSAAIVERYASQPRVVSLRNSTNLGVAGSRNRALGVARGQLITFLDQDDIWLPRKLELQVAAIRAHPEVGLLHAEYARIDSAGELLPAYRNLPPSRFADAGADVDVRDVFAEIFVTNDIQPLTTMIRRDVLVELGPFDPSLRGTDDYELWLRIALRYPVGHLRTIVGFWRAHPAQQSNRGYEQLVMRLKAIDMILGRFPEARKRVPRSAFRRRVHSMCRYIADENLHIFRNYQLARQMYLRAMKTRPGDVHSTVRYVYCLLPEKARQALRWMKRSLSGVFVTPSG